jgi:lycopene cyclase-like protein
MQLIIIGSGPSGLLLATYISIIYPDYKIKICDANLYQEWHCTYCAFGDEFKNSWFEKLFDDNQYIYKSWKGFEFKNDINSIRIEKTYIELNNSIIKIKLLDILKFNANIDLIKNNAKNIDSDKVILTDDSVICADLIIDCSGQKSKFFKYVNDEYSYEQIFYGKRIESNKINIQNPDYITIMDFTSSKYDNLVDYKTFTYILPYSNNDVFFEETILSIPKPNNINYKNLKTKLNLKLKTKYKNLFKANKNDHITFIEKNRFDFEGNTAIPIQPNKFLYSYGATSGLLNPISGYMFGFLIYDIPLFVDNLFNMTKKDYGSNKIKKLIYTFGGDVLLELQKKENKSKFDDFYTSFFNQSIDKWYPFLVRRATIWEIIINMIRFFINIKTDTKIILIWCIFKNFYKYFKFLLI